MKNLTCQLLAVIISVFFFTGCASLNAQKDKAKTTLTYNKNLYSGLKYRLVGPFRGGRSCTATGVPGKPNLYYFGSVGGGVWKTTDAGTTWENISDGYFGGSIGAVAVSEACLLYTSPSPRDATLSRMPSSA